MRLSVCHAATQQRADLLEAARNDFSAVPRLSICGVLPCGVVGIQYTQQPNGTKVEGWMEVPKEPFDAFA